MEELVSYMKKSGLQYMASIGLDGRPKVRPFQFMFEENGKLWFCTSNQKEIFRELQKQAYVELCASVGGSWLRLSGTVVFSGNLKVKEKVFTISPLVKGIYKKANNPHFEVFYLEDLSALIDEIGKAPRLITG